MPYKVIDYNRYVPLKQIYYPCIFKLLDDFITSTRLSKEVAILGRVRVNNARSKLFKELNTRDIFDLPRLFFKLFFNTIVLQIIYKTSNYYALYVYNNKVYSREQVPLVVANLIIFLSILIYISIVQQSNKYKYQIRDSFYLDYTTTRFLLEQRFNQIKAILSYSPLTLLDLELGNRPLLQSRVRYLVEVLREQFV